jgi:ferredoxin
MAKRFFHVFRILPSTQAYLREACQKAGFGLVECIHGYIYARWPFLYVRIGTGEHPLIPFLTPLFNFLLRFFTHHPVDKPTVTSSGLKLTRPVKAVKSGIVTFADTYHGKVIRLESAKKLVTINKEIQLTDLEKVIPYSQARDLIVRHPDHILLLECPCRSARPNPCLPLEVCLIIGEPFAGFAAEHYPNRCRWITSEEAVQVLQAAARRGHLHHAFFKEAMLGRFYAICNCCACCCGALQAQRNGVPMLASSGYVSRIDSDKCLGCGACIDICPFKALLAMEDTVKVNESVCMGCGLCITQCPAEAIALGRDPSKGEPLEVDELTAAREIH